MKKIKGFVNKNYKVVIGIIIGITISIGIGVSAVATKDVVYDNSKSGLTSTNMQGAIDELNTKATTKINEAEKKCPTGYICTKSNSNIVKAYTYNSTSCITGEESTCVENSCYVSQTSGSCPAGTIIKYKVNDSTTKYFHVLHDDGATMTLQQRENIVKNSPWNYDSTGVSGDNTSGPMTVLPQLESATSGWTNVNDQTYTMGTTNFNNTNAYTGCSSYNSCTTNTYTLGQRTAKARMITVQEAAAVGCTNSSKSCPNWMNNYLACSTNYGGTVSEGSCGYPDNDGYWTMSTYSSKKTQDNAFAYAWLVGSTGNVLEGYYYAYGARAVVVINK